MALLAFLRLTLVLQRAAFVRHQLQEHDMPVDEAPEDDEVRQTYNFAPGNYGLVYRADVPDYGAGQRNNDAADASEEDALPENADPPSSMGDGKDTKYKLQAMKWGEDLQPELLC